MTMYYSPRDDRLLAEDRAKDLVVEQATGRKPESSAERERIWKTIKDAARS